MDIYAVPILKDNYVWVIVEDNSAYIVDPGEWEPVNLFLKENNLSLKGVLITHSHDDHIGGLPQIQEDINDIIIYGPVEVSEYVTDVVNDGDTINIFDSEFKVLEIPGHTKHHVIYHSSDFAFVGDVIFTGGVGRVFTKDYKGMFEGLQKIKTLPKNIRIFPGHEYTITNLSFATEIFPEDSLLKKALNEAYSNVEQSTTLNQELKTNVFLRTNSLEEFTKLRNLRDDY